jgi:hypothetical protein
MFSLIKWLNNCFHYYFSGQVKEQLIAKINDEKNNIQPIVRQDLIASIIQDHPQRLVTQVEQLPDKIRDELMGMIMQAQDVCINQQDQVPTQVTPATINIVRINANIDQILSIDNLYNEAIQFDQI